MKQFIATFICVFSLSSSPSTAEIIGGFDLGSGAIKMIVADVDLHTDSVQKVLVSKKIPVPMNRYLQESLDHMLSDEAQTLAITALLELKEDMSTFVPDAWAGVATAVYREAKNGEEVIQTFSDLLDIPIRIISQEEEGRLGFMTAAAASGKPHQDLIAFDVGGGSLQISAWKKDATPGEEIQVYKAPIGGITAFKILIEEVLLGTFQNRSPHPLPVTTVQMMAFNHLLQESLPDCPLWLKEKIWQENPHIVGIGGDRSMFAIASKIAGQNFFDLDDVAKMTCEIEHLHDEDMQNFPEPELLASNLGLLYSVMSKLGLESIEFTPVTGNLLGIISNPAYLTQYKVSDVITCLPLLKSEEEPFLDPLFEILPEEQKDHDQWNWLHNLVEILKL